MELDEKQKKMIAAIDAANEQLVSISHQIHDRPEISYQEEFASGLLRNALSAHGFQIEHNFSRLPTAFRATKGQGGPRVGILAKYDALHEVGHACGHNLIAGAALAAGIGLSEVIDEMEGQVVILGSPADESTARTPLLDLGVFDDLDVVMMVHPYIGNFIATESLSMEEIRIRFYGRAAHAVSAPWDGSNALDGLLLAFNNINALRHQLRPDARVHGIITNGGMIPSIIPSHTEAHFYIHARDREYLNEVVKKCKACAEGAAHATSTRVEFDESNYQFVDMVNNLALGTRIQEYMVNVLGSAPFGRESGYFGPVDLGAVSHFFPSVHVLVDIAGGTLFSLHTQEFCQAAAAPPADVVMLRSGKALALAGYDVIANPAFLGAIRTEYIRRMGRTPGHPR